MPIKHPVSKTAKILPVLLVLLSCFSVCAYANTADKISALVEKEVIRRSPTLTNSRIEVSFKEGDQTIKNIDEQDGSKKLNFKIDFPENKKLLGKLILPVDIYKNGVHKGKINLRTSIAVFAKVPFNANNVKKGQVLAAENIGLVEKDVAYLPSTVIFDPKDAVGKETTTFLPKNTVLLEWMVRNVPLIKKGEEVIIMKRGSGILVKARAIALDDGYLGKLISVKNIDSGKPVQGKVTGPKEVETL